MFANKGNTSAALAVALRREPARILIADDHELVRDALRPALQNVADHVLVVECSTLSEAIDLAEIETPLSLAVLALTMPGMNGVEGIRTFRSRFPDIPLAILSGSHGVADIVKAFDYGAIGFLSKSNNIDSIMNAIGLMLSGQRYIPGEVMDAIQKKNAASNASGPVEDAPYPLHRLTSREREVLRLLIEGRPNKAIAIVLGIQEVTVKLHIRKLLRKLRVNNRTQAVTFALQSGWGPEL